MAFNPQKTTDLTRSMLFQPLGLSVPPSDRPLPKTPAWVPPKESEKPTRAIPSIFQPRLPNQQAINAIAKPVEERIATVAPRGGPVRLVLGTDTLGGHITAIATSGSNTIYRVTWCQGEIEAVRALKLNGEDPDPSVTVTHYTGTAGQGVDPTLAAAIAGYADTLTETVDGVTVGDAYSVIVVPNGIYNGMPRFEATIDGLKVYDDRTSTTGFTANAALLMAAVARSTVYGAGRTVPAADVIACADFADELLADGVTKRHTLGLTLDTRADADQVLDVLRTYAGVITWDGGGTFRMKPDKAESSVLAITEADIIGRPRIRRTDMGEVPTAVRVLYSDTGTGRLRELAAEARTAAVDAGTEDYRPAEVRMTGITSHAQAYALAYKTLQQGQLEDLRVTVTIRDNGILLERGDVVTLTYGTRLTAKPMRVEDVREAEISRYTLELSEYQPAVYDQGDEGTPIIPDTSLPLPVLPAPTGLTIAEELYQLRDGTWSTRFRITWTGADYPYRHAYRVEIEAGGAPAFPPINTPGTEAVTGSLEDQVTYTVKVLAYSTLAGDGPAVTGTKTAQGKGLPPTDVAQVTATWLAADRVQLNWLPAVDKDLKDYEVRIGTTSSTWDTATYVGTAQTTRLEAQVPTVATHRYFVKARDSSLNPSANAATVDVTRVKPEPPAALGGFEIGGQVHLTWEASPSVFVSRYRIAWGAQGGAAANAATIDVVDGRRLITNEVPAGTQTFYAWAIDDSGEESATYRSRDLTVTSDLNSFLVESNEAPIGAGLTNMHKLANPWGTEPDTYYTSMGESPATLFPAATAAGYTNIAATYHGAGASEILTDAVSYDTVINGSWTATVDVDALVGSIASDLELSDDGGAVWTSQGGLTAKAGADRARVRINADSGETMVVRAPVTVRVDAVPQSETIDGSYTPGKYALELDGDGDYATRAHESYFDITGDITICAWARQDNWQASGFQPGILVKGSSQATSEYQIKFNNTAVLWAQGDGAASWTLGVANMDQYAPNGRWFHVAATRSGTTVSIYIDGVLKAQGIATVTPALNTHDVHIGRYGGQYLQGGVFDVRLYSSAKTAVQVDAIMRSMGALTDTANLKSAWFTDNTPNDQSGNGKTMTLGGDPQYIPQGERVFLEKSYTAAKEVDPTPIGSAWRGCMPDNITPGELSFVDVFGFDSAFNLAATNFKLKWFGV